MKAAVFVGLRVIALTVILAICVAVGGGAVGLQADSQSPEQGGATALLLLAVCFLQVVVLTHLIIRSRWAGWRLVATVLLVFYGVMTFMPQIESAVFLNRLPPGTLPRLFLMGALVAAPFSVLAVLILGKRKAGTVDPGPDPRVLMPASEWAWKLAVIALVYLILYFTFGYFIAWKDPAVPQYYGGTDPGSFFAQMRAVMRDMPSLIPFQILRAMLWVALALPVIRMLKGQWPETAIALGSLFAVMTAPLLLPNPYMPEEVRMAHLRETASSNFLFGMFIGWLLTQRHSFAKVALERAR
jgi:hypothetical protein